MSESTPPATPPAETSPAATPPAAPATPPAPDASWFASADQDFQGWLQNKGLAAKDAPTAALEAAKMFREFEKAKGVPADRLLTLPADPNDKAAMDAIYERLGRPNAPGEYGLKVAEDKSDETYVEWAQGIAHELGLTKAQAASFDTKLREYVAQYETETETVTEAERAANIAKLQAEWGNTFHTNMELAKATVRKLGADAETLTALEEAIGTNSGVAKLFQKIGAGMGESGFVIGGTTSVLGATTPEGAAAKIKELKGDPDFVSAYNKEILSKPGPKSKIMQDLHILAAGGKPS